MPQMSKHIKVKRATLLVKKPKSANICFKIKSNKLLCEKLKINNNSLAKALSKEKRNCQSLFSQNVALLAQVQDSNSVCNKRNTIISNILTNSKEMLHMLVTMTGYLTNNISMCQEITESADTNLQRPCSSIDRRDSSKRLSIKSPARGLVTPMVGGHAITKPTINLKRVNMRHISNPPNLSTIQEVTMPSRDQGLNNSRSLSATVPVIRQHTYEIRGTCRLPEELTVDSPQSYDSNNNNDDNADNKSERMNELYSSDEERKETSTDSLEESSCSTNSSISKSLSITESGNASDSEDCMEFTLPVLSESNKCVNREEVSRKKECPTDEENKKNDSPSNTTASTDLINENEYRFETERAANSGNYITQRRGCFEIDDEDDDDFTLMYTPQAHNMHFDINDLKLPNVEESSLSSKRPVEPEPEITTTLRGISQICPVPSVSSSTSYESTFNESTVNLSLPMNMNSDDVIDVTPLQDRLKSLCKKDRVKRVSDRASDEIIESFIISTPVERNVSQRRKMDQSVNKDPSTVKVVLQKLDESEIKSRTPSCGGTSYRDSNALLNPARTDNLNDPENGNTSNTSSASTFHRPRRKGFPVNLQEPSLRKKLRRDH